MAHTQLTSEQRYQIRALMQTNQPPTKIAKIIGVDRSTIYRELKRSVVIGLNKRMRKPWLGDKERVKSELRQKHGHW